MANRRRARGGAIHFPPREGRCYHLVFGGEALREWAWLDPSELADRAVRWLDGRGDARVGGVVRALVDRGEAVVLDVIERPPGPALPPVVAPNGVAAAADRLERATVVLRVEARNPATAEVGYPGLWCAQAVAGAAAAATDGVWFDAVALRILGGADHDTAPAFGAVPMGDHLLLTQAADGPGTATLSTRGMAAFGLPELGVGGVPTALGPAAGLLLQGVAQRLVEGLLDDLQDAVTGVLPHELVVTGGHVARAVDGARPRDDGAVRLWLAHRPPTDGGDDHLEVEPSGPDATRSRAEWLRLVLADLVAN